MRRAERGVIAGEPGRLKVPKGHCRGCGKPVPKGSRSWCSQECIERQMIRNQPAHARFRVLQRDKGVCAGCGRDCVDLERRITAWVRATHLPDDIPGYRRRMKRATLAERFGVRISGHGHRFASIASSTWQADHIIPVIEGGGGCGLDNLRTLCSCCHKAATRVLATRRAWLRKRLAAWRGDKAPRTSPPLTPMTPWEELEWRRVQFSFPDA